MILCIAARAVEAVQTIRWGLWGGLLPGRKISGEERKKCAKIGPFWHKKMVDTVDGAKNTGFWLTVWNQFEMNQLFIKKEKSAIVALFWVI